MRVVIAWMFATSCNPLLAHKWCKSLPFARTSCLSKNRVNIHSAHALGIASVQDHSGKHIYYSACEQL